MVEALREVGCNDFGYFDILTDQDVRAGIKQYSNWPTYPQLYVDGELLGGCDIIEELKDAGVCVCWGGGEKVAECVKQ